MAETWTKQQIVELVDEGAKLADQLSGQKMDRLSGIKSILRDLANGRDKKFEGSNGRFAVVAQKPDAIVRVAPDPAIIFRFIGKHFRRLLPIFFSLHPKKDFELNAHKHLPKDDAEKFVDEFTDETTPWVTFG